jgi:hypothetical protein
MANGLIGGFGSFGQTQGQTQGNLLGGVFQQQPTRGELRRGLLSDIVQQYGGNAQQTGGAAIGAGLGIGISKLLGRDVQGAERADKIRRVQNQVSQEQGLNFATNPQQAFMRTAELLQGEGLQQEAIQAMMQARQFAPEQPEGLYGQFVAAKRAGDLPADLGFEEFRQGSGPQQNVTVESPNVPLDLTDPQKSVIDNYVKTGQSAVNSEFDLFQAGEILAQEDVETGRLQPLILSVQGISEDLGLDFNELLTNSGFESVGDLSSKEELDRVLNRLLINSFDKFKGNLNTREVNIAFDANSNLGRSTEANIRGVATQIAASEIARERANRAVNIRTPDEFKEFQKEVNQSGTERLIELRDKYEKQIREGQFGQSSTNTSDTSQGGGRLRYNPETGTVE